jgi:hypothetical protein
MKNKKANSKLALTIRKESIPDFRNETAYKIFIAAGGKHEMLNLS